MELQVIDIQGSEAGTLAIGEVFEKSVRGDLVHQMVRSQLNAKRSGTHSCKTRSEVRGGGRKPFRQKGTGSARAGSSSSPLWVGGGVAHGPKNRSYDFNINKKEKRAALASAISVRVESGAIKIVKELSFTEIKTKLAKAALKRIGIEGSALVVLAEKDSELSSSTVKSLRNIEGIKIISSKGLNVYDILNHSTLLVSEEAWKEVEGRLA